ncbi:hypothetical protein N7470_006009 [Penicillium chermesinum]|nr:hypothetical protein N7470_006009 [Penicillium chermesinum]
MQTRVRDLFRSLFDRQEDVEVIDAGRSLEEVSRDMQAAVTACFDRLDAIGPLRAMEGLAN